jgi:N-acetylglucosaminyldiphosphoundecaprenol N-acetyl-beta-D-mannosaminyltransferase
VAEEHAAHENREHDDAGLPNARERLPPVGRVDILGVGVHALDLEAVTALLDHALRATGKTFLITANPEFVMLAREDPAVRATAERADAVVPDGVGIVLASHILGRPLPGRARGRELVTRLAETAARLEMSIYLLGAREGVAARAAESLRRSYPRLRIAGTFAGSPAPAEDPELVARVNEALPDILLIAYGMPHQELWIARNLPRLGSRLKVVMGVGGAFDYLAGEAPLPPEWMARAGLEWLWRLWTQPWRWRRQLAALPLFLLLVLRERLVARRSV